MHDAYQEQAKQHVNPHISHPSQPHAVCTGSCKLPSTSPTTSLAPSSPYLSFLPLRLVLKLRLPPFTKPLGLGQNVPMTSLFPQLLSPPLPKIPFGRVIISPGIGPVSCYLCLMPPPPPHPPLKYTSTYVHTHISTSSPECQPKPAAGSAVKTCPHTSTFLEAILARWSCQSLSGGNRTKLFCICLPTGIRLISPSATPCNEMHKEWYTCVWPKIQDKNDVTVPSWPPPLRSCSFWPVSEAETHQQLELSQTSRGLLPHHLRKNINVSMHASHCKWTAFT